MDIITLTIPKSFQIVPFCNMISLIILSGLQLFVILICLVGEEEGQERMFNLVMPVIHDSVSRAELIFQCNYYMPEH